VKKQNQIVDSEYRLNILDVMELLIAVLIKEISTIKRKQSLKEKEEKLKIETELKKTQRKSTKVPQQKKIRK
jgi:hypothetical protein